MALGPPERQRALEGRASGVRASAVSICTRAGSPARCLRAADARQRRAGLCRLAGRHPGEAAVGLCQFIIGAGGDCFGEGGQGLVIVPVIVVDAAAEEVEGRVAWLERFCLLQRLQRRHVALGLGEEHPAPEVGAPVVRPVTQHLLQGDYGLAILPVGPGGRRGVGMLGGRCPANRRGPSVGLRFWRRPAARRAAFRLASR